MNSKLLGELPVVNSHKEYENNFKNVYKMESQGILSMLVFLKCLSGLTLLQFWRKKLVLPLLVTSVLHIFVFQR